MCGIAGHFGRPVGPEIRRAMLDALETRGPDAQHIVTFAADGTLIEAQSLAATALVHARLSIIDPRPDADQPMASADGRVWISYNGEVYGWQSEARALEARGAHFRTRSDTEFILHAYDAYGIDGLISRLDGMFAFALVDFRTRRVHLVRDRLGKKPLLYAHVDGNFAFGSTVRSILPWLPEAHRGFSREGIDAFLAHRYIPAPRTVFTAIARLPNGHRLEYPLAGGDVRITRYWAPTADVEASSHAAALFDEAIEKRLVADRPLGLFLSGGIDSTAIACRLAAYGHVSLHSFSAGFPGSTLDESAQAAATARSLGMPNKCIAIPERIGAEFDRIVASLDEPFADPSSFPTWFLARETVKEITVVLGGDGGDELFAGYKRVAKHVRNGWREGWRPAARVAGPDGGNGTQHSVPHTGWRVGWPVWPSVQPKGWRKIAAELSMSWEDAYSLRFSGLTPNQRRFLQPDAGALPPHYWRAPDMDADNRTERLLRWDFANYLPEYVLRKADLCTMAHGLELRAPLLDHRFVEAVLGLPPAVRFTNPPKRFLTTLAPELDRLGVFAHKKRGFNPPLDAWLSGDLASRLRTAGTSLQELTGGQLQADRVDVLMQSYAHIPALAEQVLSLIMLDESLRQLAALAAHFCNAQEGSSPYPQSAGQAGGPTTTANGT